MSTIADKEFGTIGRRRAGTTAEKGFGVGTSGGGLCGLLYVMLRDGAIKLVYREMSRKKPIQVRAKVGGRVLVSP